MSNATSIVDGTTGATADMARSLFWLLAGITVLATIGTIAATASRRRNRTRRTHHHIPPTQALYESILAELGPQHRPDRQPVAAPGPVTDALRKIDAMAARGDITDDVQAALTHVLSPTSNPSTSTASTESSAP